MGVINLMKGLFYGGNHMYYIGVDLGTSSLKLLLMDEKVKFKILFPKNIICIFQKRDGQNRIHKIGGVHLKQEFWSC